MPLTELSSKIKRPAKKRVGRGNGSGMGTYAGRGQKGQTSRSGGKRRPGFEGGQTPFAQKMPKLRGFKNPNHLDYLAINVGDLEEKFKGQKEITLSNKRKPFKLLGNGEITTAFKITVDKASASAIEKVTKAGGSVEVVNKKVEKTSKKDKKEVKSKAEESKEESPKE
ncbi:50S ribosomal protein L15 [Candidatus Peregrinibacteria bacterium]|jgi:large subunit ribosomal protein L15|nr:50S ribosomal protein L15 [Candidatus Peregrinibacteria bacterium]MBT4055683.1 50S ribosomal protein L15 [Candidatus Peregrinibacteria bacterium]